MPAMSSDWEPDLRKTAAAHKRAQSSLKRAREALDQQMAKAAEAGASLREIKAITGLNHETIRTAITRVQAGEHAPPADDHAGDRIDAPATANPDRSQVE